MIVLCHQTSIFSFLLYYRLWHTSYLSQTTWQFCSSCGSKVLQMTGKWKICLSRVAILTNCTIFVNWCCLWLLHITKLLHMTNLQYMLSCHNLCCFVAIYALSCGAKISQQILSVEPKWQISCMVEISHKFCTCRGQFLEGLPSIMMYGHNDFGTEDSLGERRTTIQVLDPKVEIRWANISGIQILVYDWWF